MKNRSKKPRDSRIRMSGQVIRVLGKAGKTREPVLILEGLIEYCPQSNRILYWGYYPKTGEPECLILKNVTKIKAKDTETFESLLEDHSHHRARYLYLKNGRLLLTNTPPKRKSTKNGHRRRRSE